MTNEQRKQIETICDAVLGPAPERVLYYMGDEGWLWSGPHKTNSNFHYARFYGFMTCEPFSPIWVLEKSDADYEWTWITDEMAEVYVDKIKTGVWKLPTAADRLRHMLGPS